MPESIDSRNVTIAAGWLPGNGSLAEGIEIREFASAASGARGLSTGTATFHPGAELPCHTHTFSEAVTILEGEAAVLVEDRCYRLTQYDAIHFPRGVAHGLINPSQDARLVAHWVFASESPTREPALQRGGFGNYLPEVPSGSPEHITRFSTAEVYLLSENAQFRDLFGGNVGAVGVCGGYGLFGPGASLPCHIHRCDESITIVAGKAVCEVKGRRWELSNFDTARIPEGWPHRFLNETDEPMAMVWVYASSEPERTILDSRYCSGETIWPGREQA